MGVFDWHFLIGRILFSLIFLFSGMSHFLQHEQMSQYAAAKGVPAPGVMVPLTGLMIVAGGISVLFWWWVEIGAWLIILFLLAAAARIHDFWALEDPAERQAQMAQFMKNISMAGAALIFYAASQNPMIFA